MKRICFAIGLAVSASVGLAQENTTVSPPGFENQAGNAAEPVFLGSREYQQLFRASSFNGAWTTPVLITDIAFRLHPNVSSMSAVYPRLEIRLSTSSRPLEQMSTRWEDNRGLDDTMVFLRNNYTLSAAGGQAVNPFELRFHLDQPFVYDPGSGNLAMSIRPTVGSGGARTIDAHSYPNFGSSPPVAATTANFIVPAPYGIVTEFTWVAIPEPPALHLVASIIVAGAFWFRRKGGHFIVPAPYGVITEFTWIAVPSGIGRGFVAWAGRSRQGGLAACVLGG